MTMRIKGPKPPPPQPKVDGSQSAGADKQGGVSGAGSAQAESAQFGRLMAPEQASDSSATTGPAALGHGDAVSALAARVEAGELSADAASRQLVDQLVKVRGASLDAEGQQRLREQLERALREDPTLVARLARVDGLTSREG